MKIIKVKLDWEDFRDLLEDSDDPNETMSAKDRLTERLESMFNRNFPEVIIEIEWTFDWGDLNEL